jgi:hypothetical protein
MILATSAIYARKARLIWRPVSVLNCTAIAIFFANRMVRQPPAGQG